MALSVPPEPVKRCSWAKTDLSISYHDCEWGVPVHDDRKLFEFLLLEGAQAGLSWETVLRKRENYRRAFDDFDPRKVAGYTQQRVAKLLENEGIIRNRLKIAAAVQNARAFLAVQQEYGTFDAYLWRFTERKTLRRKPGTAVPTCTNESDLLSRDLKKRGFNFVGSTICYSFMQAIGMVNDHDVSCFRYGQVNSEGAAL